MRANVQHLFKFPTYIVSKLYEEYHEDTLVVENNLNMSGGLFKSPTNSPTHQSKKASDRAVNGLKKKAMPAMVRSDSQNSKGKGQELANMQRMLVKPGLGRSDFNVPAIKISDYNAKTDDQGSLKEKPRMNRDNALK